MLRSTRRREREPHHPVTPRPGLQFVTPWGVGVLLDGALKNVEHLRARLRAQLSHRVEARELAASLFY